MNIGFQLYIYKQVRAEPSRNYYLFSVLYYLFSISLFHKIQCLKVLNLYDSVQSVSARFLDFYTRL